ncbi:hypothetical protein FPK15_contig00064-0001 [Flavobacterium psychrophilum]|nr:hypothetical protein FPK15_contig00064-0001 [Flavobacterium psychrophilum]
MPFSPDSNGNPFSFFFRKKKIGVNSGKMDCLCALYIRYKY